MAEIEFFKNEEEEEVDMGTWEVTEWKINDKYREPSGDKRRFLEKVRMEEDKRMRRGGYQQRRRKIRGNGSRRVGDEKGRRREGTRG